MIEILFFLSAFLAGVLGTIAGFGSSTIFLPLALFFVDFKTALTLVACFHVFGNLSRMTLFRQGMDRKLILLFGIPSVILTIVGAFLVNSITQSLLKFILGLFLFAFSILSMVKLGFKARPSNSNVIIGGSMSGFLAGLIGTGGALRGAFLTAFSLPKEVYIATSAAIALVVDITRIPIYLTSGFLEQQWYWYLPIMAVIAVLSSYIGKKIVDKIPQQSFKKGVLLMILGISIKFLYDGLSTF
ncbi:MAG TPA: sulfite exporter TauE/SafE family protein [Candidatus Nanoarchaeia archaeon]|nr:sulfite exporter TauE/SafE family protein [Candidatus Nanoarchaeia archaeon]